MGGTEVDEQGHKGWLWSLGNHLPLMTLFVIELAHSPALGPRP